MRKLAFLLLLSVEVLLAGTTGKIAGRITDAVTGQPIPFANVFIEGTTMGAAADAGGNYFLINVPVGTYTVRGSAVGYAARGVSGVKVIIDMTSTVDFILESRDVRVGEVVVAATRPAIQQDLTSTKHTVDQDVISMMPVDDFREVVQLQAGVNGSHFRGGRFNEALFLVDGIQVKSAINGYTGYTAGFATNLPQLGVSEIQVSTGGFEAEYGNAQSGVVNTLTRDPGSKLAGKFRARTSDFPWSKMKWIPDEYGDGQPDWKNLEAFLASPLLTVGDFRFALNGSADVAWQTKDFLPHEDFYKESYQAKATVIRGDTRIQLSGLRSWSTSNGYYHRYSRYGPLSEGYQYDLFQRPVSGGILEQYIFVVDPWNYPSPSVTDPTDSIAFDGKKYGQVRNIYQAGMQKHISIPTNNSFNVAVAWTQNLSASSFLEVKLSEFYTRFHETVQDVDDRNKNGNVTEELQWIDNSSNPFPTKGYQDRLFTESYWYYSGDEGWWFDQTARTYSFRADYSNQFDRHNLLKSGIEFNYNGGNVDKVSFESVTNPRLDIWAADLYDFAAYVQDKIEVRDGFILNAGLRLDYYDPNGFGAPVRYPADPADLADPVKRAALTDANKPSPRWQVSPRIGISHPITERDKIHFYYGHFFQRPDFRYLYENINLNFRYTTNVDVGNPSLRPEKTVSYEMGWEHLFANDIRFSLTGYFKDITNLVGANDFAVPGATELYQVFMNLDYANVRGIEVTLETLGLKPIGGMINYTYAFANGRSSSVFRSNGEIVPRRLDPLQWDIRHRINANIVLRSMGSPLERLIGPAELDFIFTAQSGYPYTTNTRDVFPLFALRNDGRLPWTKNVDLRLRKTFALSSIDLSFLGEVRNLFNWRNVEYIAGAREGLIIFEQTGNPRGPYLDPQTYSPPRVYRLGFEVQM